MKWRPYTSIHHIRLIATSASQEGTTFGNSRVWVAVVALWFAESALSAPQRETVMINVRMYDRVGIPEVTLKIARDETVRIFRAAGIDIHWVNCVTAHGRAPNNPSCDSKPSALDLTLNILDVGPPAAHPLECGYALGAPKGHFADYAVIYYRAIEARATQDFAARPLLLGEVIAHELGHLFLGPSSHSRSGIMSSDLGGKRTTELVFSAEQRARIFHNMLARARASTVAGAPEFPP